MITLVSIYLAGILSIFMGIFHIRFPKLFKWGAEYKNNSTLNKKIFFTIHLALLLLFLIFGAFTLAFAKELSECNGIAFGINLCFSLFWIWRAIWQIFYFKGKAMHYILIAYFTLLFIGYFVPIASKLA